MDWNKSYLTSRLDVQVLSELWNQEYEVKLGIVVEIRKYEATSRQCSSPNRKTSVALPGFSYKLGSITSYDWVGGLD